MTMKLDKPIHVPTVYGDLPGGWTWGRLDEVTIGVFDCPHSTPKLTESGPYVVRTQDIISGVFRAEQAARVSEETYVERIARVTPNRGDLLYSREGTYFGIAAEVPERTRVCLGQRMVLIRPDKHRLDFSFLRYWLNSPIMAAHIHGYRDGSVAERLNLPTIRALPILLPPLLEQKGIARILGILDDKIELNRRMNATLEAMARALFQSWFVDFDPVRAKLDGCQPASLDPAIAALFPDSFQDSELGHIPEGWRVLTVGETCEAIFSGGTPSTTNPAFWTGRLPWLSSGETRNSFIVDTEKTITEDGVAGSSTRLARAGCTVIAGAGQGHTRGQTSLLTFDSYINQSVVALAAKEGLSSDLFLYFDLARRYEEFRQISDSHSSRGSLTTKLLAAVRCVMPSSELITAFESTVRPLVSLIAANIQQSRTLATLRDTMLPKLLSGELKVPQIQPALGNILSFSEEVGTKPSRKATEEFIEAVVIAQLTRKLGTAQYPLGRMRYNKLAYLAHRKAENDVSQHYLKKAAGPYSPWAKYSGPEKIAKANGYVEQTKAGVFEGLVAGPNIGKIDQYLSHYPVCGAVDWIIGNFQYRKKDELELLATVDFAALDLIRNGKAISLDAIKQIIATNKDWAPKLDRAVFSDGNIQRSLTELAGLFPATYT